MVAAGRPKLTITLDENLLALKEPLRDAGFKVLVVNLGTPDEELFATLDGTVLLTNNQKDFRSFAVRYDFDIVSTQHIKFIDVKKDRTNETVSKISNAIRESEFYNLRGNFFVTVFNDGKWKIDELV